MINHATSVHQRDLDRYATCFTDDVEVSSSHHQITDQEIELDGVPAHLRGGGRGVFGRRKRFLIRH